MTSHKEIKTGRRISGTEMNELQAIKEIKGGINSRIKVVVDNSGVKYIHKSYGENNEDKRGERESKFLAYASGTDAHRYVPKIIHYNKEKILSIQSFIDGQKIDRFNNIHSKHFCDFIGKLNNNNQNELIGLSNAKDACTSHKTIKDDVMNRLEKMMTVKPKSEIEKWITLWLKDELKEKAENCLDEYQNVAKEVEWEARNIQFIASPSDVGIHNMMQRDERFYFIDFEYAGMDDLTKLACDWVLQPNHMLRKQEEEYFLNYLTKEMKKINDSWKARYPQLKKILFIKWVLIMLRSYAEHQIRENQWKKVESYYKWGIKELNII